MASFFRRRRSFLIKISFLILGLYILSLFVFGTESKEPLPAVETNGEVGGQNVPFESVRRDDRNLQHIQPQEQVNVQQNNQDLRFRQGERQHPKPKPVDSEQRLKSGDKIEMKVPEENKEDDRKRPDLQYTQELVEPKHNPDGPGEYHSCP